jgi:YidC/Oxa1 family membrane protein insertase
MFALFNPALNLIYPVLIALAARTEPLLGSAATACALVILTLAARTCLLPFAVRVVRAERAKQALAPQLNRIRDRHRQDPARQARELQKLYRQAGISPLTGLLPALAQIPVMIVIYRLCRAPMVAGQHNALLSANLFGAPLAAHAPAVITTAGLFSGPTALILGLVAVLLVLAHVSSTQQLRRLAANGETPPLQALIARIMPYATLLTAAVVPLAVSLYLLTSTTWVVIERAVLTHLS